MRSNPTRLSAKLLAIRKQTQVHYHELIKDDGRNIYETIQTIFDALSQHHIWVWHSVHNQKVTAHASGYLTSVEVIITFVDTTCEETHRISAYGDSFNSEDEGSAKATSQAYINALMATFTHYTCRYL